jgi:hypothetical protein
MAKKSRQPQKKKLSKLFVLDTNVLMHDPTSLFRFEEHDIYLPIGTLEELDDHKKGLSDVARNARQASRFLDEIVTNTVGDISAGIPIAAKAGRDSARTPVPADRSDQRRAAGDARLGQDRQPDSFGRASPAKARAAAPGDPGVEGHQHADQGEGARPLR